MGDVIDFTKLTFDSKNLATQLSFSMTGNQGPIMQITGEEDRKLIIYGTDGQEIVRILMKTGTVEIKNPGALTEAAQQFWKAIAMFCPL